MQLFLEFDESIKVPTIAALLMKMFKDQKIAFAKVDTYLFLSLHFLIYMHWSAGPVKAVGSGSKVWEAVPDIQEDHS